MAIINRLIKKLNIEYRRRSCVSEISRKQRKKQALRLRKRAQTRFLKKGLERWWSTMNLNCHCGVPTYPPIEHSTPPTKIKLQTKKNFLENKKFESKFQSGTQFQKISKKYIRESCDSMNKIHYIEVLVTFCYHSWILFAKADKLLQLA